MNSFLAILHSAILAYQALPPPLPQDPIPMPPVFAPTFDDHDGLDGPARPKSHKAKGKTKAKATAETKAKAKAKPNASGKGRGSGDKRDGKGDFKS